MVLQAMTCPGCGANVGPAEEGATVTCPYCGTVSKVPRGPVARPPVAPNPAAGVRVALVATAAIGVAVMGLVAAVLAGSRASEGSAAVRVVPAPPSPPSVPSDPAPPAARVDAPNARAARLDAVVRACFARYDDRILASRARYRSWVDFDEGPRANARHVYGLYTFSDPEHCAESVAAATALAPPLGSLDVPARAYVRALEALHPVVEEANRYYDRSDYQDDAMARGKALHGSLLEHFDAYLAARQTLLEAVEAPLAAELDAVESGLAPGDARGRLVVDTLRGAQELAGLANVPWRELGRLEGEAFAAKVEGYQRQLDELEALGAGEDRDLGRYLQTSQGFAQSLKALRRRVERGGGWTRGNRMMLRGVASHWMVEGSPGAAMAKYADIVVPAALPPLLPQAPVLIFTEGY
ncbi:MAG: DUF3829 domain-containing protein [Myxococcota bacterium]